MASVTFSSSVGGDNSTVTDDSSPTTGLKAGGSRTRFVPLLTQTVAVAAFTVSTAAAAAASALTAVNAPGTTATDTTTSLSLANTGDVTFAIQAGKTIVPGMYFRAAQTTNPAVNWMSGFVKSYSGTALVITMDTKSTAAGPFTGYTLSLAATTAGSVTSSRQVLAAGLATGGGALTGDVTITVTASTPAQTAAGTSQVVAMTPYSYAQSLIPQVLTDGATISTWAMATASNAKVTLGGTGRTFVVPTGMLEGQFYSCDFIQDGTGNRTVTTWPASFHWGVVGAPTLSTAANARDVLTLKCVDAATPIFVATMALGF